MTVVVPTIGRPRLLEACLRSLAACDPAAREILVVDQSDGPGVGAVVARFHRAGARRVPCPGRGIALAVNVGWRAASHDTVLVTHDDCTVAPDWVGAAVRLLGGATDTLLSGRVLPVGDPLAVPSTKDDPERRDFTGERECGALFPNNMVVTREGIRGLGGFDERFTSAAEDNDLCYRWLRAGRTLRYEPELVVWHHDWRTHAELEAMYTRYWYGQGQFYGKHLRLGDWTMLRFLASDLRATARSRLGAVILRKPRWSDPRRFVLRGLPKGLWRELRR